MKGGCYEASNFLGKFRARTRKEAMLFELEQNTNRKSTVFGRHIYAIYWCSGMDSIDNGLSLMNADLTFQYAAKGLILPFAVWVDIASHKRSS